MNSGVSCRVAMYSHDALGMGHLRRNRLIARALHSSSLSPTLLLISGTADVANSSVEAGIDWLILPALRKISNGSYEPRRLEMPTEDLLAIRSHAICAALDVFQPD